jgi:hypothetical protein
MLNPEERGITFLRNVGNCKTTRRHIPEELNRQQHRSENHTTFLVTYVQTDGRQSDFQCDPQKFERACYVEKVTNEETRERKGVCGERMKKEGYGKKERQVVDVLTIMQYSQCCDVSAHHCS